ncbi:hypothetical protein [Spiroplasma endosymbiont of Aspidapion aeneum]|uniref:hypothetical protein n=1 Tax=Spiroplasma endosymbiont of Aspidapion aeneum TaxID=3066276 RepID=UPI00313BEAE4
MKYDVLEFDPEQLIKISSGLELGLSKESISLVACPYFNKDQMEWLKNCLLRNYPLSWVSLFAHETNDSNFLKRMYELICHLVNWKINDLIKKNESIGLVESVKTLTSYLRELEDTKKTDYNDPKIWKKIAYSQSAINESLIRENHIKRLCYLLDNRFSFDCVVKACFLQRKDFDIFIDINLEGYNEKQLDVILDGMLDRIEYQLYLASEYSANMMRLIYEALKDGVSPKKIRDNIWMNSTENDVARLIREKNAYQTNQLNYQLALKKYKDKEIRRCIICEEYFTIDQMWDLNIDNSICVKCHVKNKNSNNNKMTVKNIKKR